MGSIFISYRREDAEGQAGRLYDDLVAAFGSDAVFMDVAAIQPGRDFRKAIDQSLTACGVFLSLIGRNWLTAKDPSDRRRLDDPADFVRIETAAALKRDIPVIPVLVQSASVPKPDQLPGDLQDLAFRNAMELTHTRWDSDIQLLIKALRPYVSAVSHQEQPEVVPSGKKLNGAKYLLLAGVVLLVVVAAIYFRPGSKVANPPAKEPSETATAAPDAKSLVPKSANSYPEKVAAQKQKADPKISSLDDFSLAAVQKPTHIGFNTDVKVDQQRYTFTLSLKAPDGAIDDIDRVHYDFVYESNPLSIDGGSAPGFSAVYEGWGCYQTVVVTVYFKTPGVGPFKRTFNMCKALS